MGKIPEKKNKSLIGLEIHLCPSSLFFPSSGRQNKEQIKAILSFVQLGLKMCQELSWGHSENLHVLLSTDRSLFKE